MLKPVEEVSDDSEEPSQSVRASSLKPVAGISSDSNDSAAEQPGQRTSKNKRKRRRATELPPMRERLTSESYLKSTLGKACLKCKQSCMGRFSTDEKLAELKAFRDHWVSLNKLDQDQLVARFIVDLLVREGQFNAVGNG